MFNNRSLKAAFLLTIFLLASFAFPVAADDGDGSLWGEVLNADGTIRYDNLTDQGVQTESADWMPSIDLGFTSVDMQAEYHVYETPSGNIVQLPTAATLFFMALNPQESGLTEVSASAGGWGSALLTAPGIVSAMLNGADIDFSGSQYVNADQYADALISGETNIWSLGVGDIWHLTQSLLDSSTSDHNLYTMLLLYTPDNIPEEIAELLPEEPTDDDDDDEPPLPPRCPAPSVAVGAITRNGTLLSPNYPLVVGQDPDKRGVDISFNVSVAPTIYTYFEEVPIYESGWCGNCNGSSTGGTPCHRCRVLTGWECQTRTQIFPETIPVAYGAVNLTNESRDWIEDTLSIRYPGAYVHHGSFSFPSSSGGSSWSFVQEHIQVQDPGEWNITIGGRTSGTPVSPVRNFGGAVNSFDVYLKETAITQ